MGKDSVEPFLSFKDRYAIILALTSNSGSKDFQLISSEGKNSMSGFLLNLENGRETKILCM